MTDDELIDEMATVYALVSARLQDDEKAYYEILLDDELSLDGLFIHMTDFAISMLKMKAMELRIPVETLVRSMAMVTRMALPDMMEERRKEGEG